MKILFSSNAWKDCLYWQKADRKTLKHAQNGYWSRGINSEHRIVYKCRDDTLLIAQLLYHYEVND
jgi:toxin YoeB